MLLRVPTAVLVVCFSAALASPLPVRYPNPNLATTVLLSDYVESHGARCLDGTPQRIWIQDAGPNATNKWAIHLQGGGWCESIDSCTSRAFSPANCHIGSSTAACFDSTPYGDKTGPNMSSVMDFRDIVSCQGARWCGGLMINNATTNPLTHDWNKVLLPYCDGGSFAGLNSTSTKVTYNGEDREIWFRGFANLNAAIDYLLASRGLGDATDLILSGDSAGGLATYWHLDHFASRLPNTKVLGAPDSGFFFEEPNIPSGWPKGLGWVVSYMNSTAGMNQNCVAAMKAAGKDPLMCRFPEVTAPHIQTPYFVMNSRFDPALDSIIAGVSSKETDKVNQIGRDMIDLINTTVLSASKNAAFITSCYQHCGQWAQNQRLKGAGGQSFNDANVTIDGFQAIPAMMEWIKGNRRTWIQKALYPCDSCCSGGDPQS